MDKYVFCTADELKQLIKEAMSGLAKPEPQKKEYFTIDEAVKYLNDKGLSISKSSLYQYTSRGGIEHGRAGERKLIFTENQLNDFLEKMIRK
ncbi:MAG TPA: helix-turn-helix domain-containing protein [Dysgonamonadaceae bacterium]|nr:helix-turn-helix domain-containing protein [Dysgonamonadaceae bacterium]